MLGGIRAGVDEMAFGSMVSVSWPGGGLGPVMAVCAGHALGFGVQMGWSLYGGSENNVLVLR
ncbi:hypothetical protein DSLASN_04310 [Desulfoluna limicola]|uniref:Uncharacterized protein n=1 Tax=Desulfoluna limicola TaxID=2810562 RepID=A0ABN6EYP7_9BACT|nr:hypothetical protein DSLASN_04310 [Desulfoluna limicola]